MQGNNSQSNSTEVKPRGLRAWWENFIYYYKWHAVIAAVLIITVVVCTVQMCSRTSYDAYELYAGGSYIGMTSSETTGESDYSLMCSALAQYAEDTDENGSRIVNLKTLYLPSEEQIAKIESEPERDGPYSLIASDHQLFRDFINTGEYYVYFVAEHLYLEWTGSQQPFLEVSPYLAEGEEYEIAEGGMGVYLRSTELKDKAGFSAMGEDTVMCIRMYSEFSSIFSDAENEKVFSESEKLFKKLLAEG